MPSNLLILPLLAGYLFLHIFLRYRFRSQSLDGYRLLLESAIAGAILLLISRFLVAVSSVFFPQLGVAWKQLVPDQPYLGTATLSIPLAFVLPWIVNHLPRPSTMLRVLSVCIRRKTPHPLLVACRSKLSAYQSNTATALDREIQSKGNALIRLLHTCSIQSHLIALTMSNRKWYVGYVAEAVRLEPNERYFRILPILSGHRDKDSMRTRPEIQYREVYSRLPEAVDLSVFEVTLALDDIQDARIFDEKIYASHFADRQTPALPIAQN